MTTDRAVTGRAETEVTECYRPARYEGGRLDWIRKITSEKACRRCTSEVRGAERWRVNGSTDASCVTASGEVERTPAAVPGDLARKPSVCRPADRCAVMEAEQQQACDQVRSGSVVGTKLVIEPGAEEDEEHPERTVRLACVVRENPCRDGCCSTLVRGAGASPRASRRHGCPPSECACAVLKSSGVCCADGPQARRRHRLRKSCDVPQE